jgi:trehalose 6-phosphate synthase/phosphatase
MQERLSRYDVSRWARDFVDSLYETKRTQEDLSVRKVTEQLRAHLLSCYRTSKKRLFLLDYDGTMVSFVGRPEKAGPDRKLVELLNKLSGQPGNEVVVISGRDKTTLTGWLGGLNLGLIAEHGAWIRPREDDWQAAEPLNTDWMDAVRPILQLYVDRTPGSSIEVKDFALVWHCRRADPGLAYLRMQELKAAILNLTARLDVAVLEGSKVIEVKNAGVNKGRAAARWLFKQDWDFIFAAGDDQTDEDTFAVLSQEAYSIKVGSGLSKARFQVDSVHELRILLEELTRN